MRIVQVCPYGWDSPGGVQSHVRGLSSALERRGHTVHVLAPGGCRNAGPSVSIVGRPLRIAYNRSIAPIGPNPIDLLRVRRFLARFDPDIVHVHEPFAPSTALWATFVSRAPLVATFHASSERLRLYRATAPLIRLVGRRCAAMLAVSDTAATLVARDLGLDATVVPNGIDVLRFARAVPCVLADSGPTVLFVGRLEPRKGLTVLAQAFGALVERIPSAQLVVIGDGPGRSAIEQLPAPVRARVRMLGALPDDQLPPYYAAADAFAGPATGQESFGIVLLEAMAAGLPIVASNLPGYRSVVRDGIEGVLVPVGDSSALAAGLARVLCDATFAAALANNGRARAQAFSWENLSDRIEAVYDAARRHPSAAPARSARPGRGWWPLHQALNAGGRSPGSAPITHSARSVRKRAAM